MLSSCLLLAAVHALVISRSDPRTAPLATCFAPDTDPRVLRAFQARDFNDRFQAGGRLAGTAYSPEGSDTGQPLTVSYSIVPDGTQVDGFNAEPASPSNLRSRLASIYGDEAAGIAHIRSAIERWSKLSGVRYVYEPNDDGQPLAYAPGVAGVRGDCRIAGHTIDGPSNILAYNFLPSTFPSSSDADMVLDTADTTFNNIASNSLLLRNVVGHEHGHGLGMAHVCPIESTRLMEPIVATNFDGPRHDEVLHAHQLYGDLFEPNDTALQATHLGTLAAITPLSVGDRSRPAPLDPPEFIALPHASPASIGWGRDVDYFSFDSDGPQRVTIRATPLGYPYDDSSQSCAGTAACCSGNVVDSAQQHKLSLTLIDTDARTVLQTVNATLLGGEAFISEALLPAPGRYYLRVKAVDSSFGSQFYALALESRSAAFTATPLRQADLVLPPGPSVAFDVRCTPDVDTIDPDASRLFVSIAAGPFREIPFRSLGDDTIRAVLHNVSCGSAVRSYAVLRGVNGSEVRIPPDAPATTMQPWVGARTPVLVDDFESDRGWTVGPNTATSGAFVRAVPVATQAQPGVDHSPGGDRCYVTANASAGAAPGTDDVDAGYTQLVSPLLDLSRFSDVEVSYWRWYSNGTSSAPFADTARFDVNPNNTNAFFWKRAETIGPGSTLDPETNGGWRAHSFRFADLGLTPTATTRLRFYVIDDLSASLVEAAIDDVAVVGFSCATVHACAGDFDADELVLDSDFLLFAAAYDTVLCPSAPDPCDADLTLDGLVDDTDFLVFVSAYNHVFCD